MTLERHHATTPHPASRPMSAEECRLWLRSHHEGRLRYLSGRGPRSVVVNYAVAPGRIILHVPDYNDIAHYAPRTRVTLEVDGRVAPNAAAERRDSVLVTGVAVLDEASAPTPTLDTERWPADMATAWISLPMTTVDGVAEGEVDGVAEGESAAEKA